MRKTLLTATHAVRPFLRHHGHMFKCLLLAGYGYNLMTFLKKEYGLVGVGPSMMLTCVAIQLNLFLKAKAFTNETLGMFFI
jgi:hypothetical protein